MAQTLINVALANALKETFGESLLGFNNVTMKKKKLHMNVIYVDADEDIVRSEVCIKLKDLGEITKESIKRMTKEEFLNSPHLEDGVLEEETTEGEEQ